MKVVLLHAGLSLGYQHYNQIPIRVRYNIGVQVVISYRTLCAVLLLECIRDLPMSFSKRQLKRGSPLVIH